MSDTLKGSLFVFLIGLASFLFGLFFLIYINKPNVIIAYRDWIDAVLGIGAGALLMCSSVWWYISETRSKNV